MSLEKFLRTKLVVLQPSATVYEVARAMDDNHIGAVLIAKDGRLQGIITDRDLALRLIAEDSDVRETTAREVMSTLVISCDLNATLNDVITTMHAAGCRRIPITREGHPVGIVTLDDLVVAGAIDLRTAQRIVASQLAIASRHKPEGAMHPGQVLRNRPERVDLDSFVRQAAHADATYRRLVRATQRHIEPRDRHFAKRALGIVMAHLFQRMRPDDARRLLAQFPSVLREEIEPVLVGVDRNIDLDEIEAELIVQLGVEQVRVNGLVSGVCGGVSDCISPGAVNLLRDHLPKSMKCLFPVQQTRHEEAS